jgi:hypothetical protein
VARQYSGTLGKVGNCQVGVSVCAVTDTASCPLSWRLFLPPGWEDTEAADEEAAAVIRARRARAASKSTPGLLATNGTRAHGRTPCALRRRPPPQARRPLDDRQCQSSDIIGGVLSGPPFMIATRIRPSR